MLNVLLLDVTSQFTGFSIRSLSLINHVQQSEVPIKTQTVPSNIALTLSAC